MFGQGAWLFWHCLRARNSSGVYPQGGLHKVGERNAQTCLSKVLWHDRVRPRHGHMPMSRQDHMKPRQVRGADLQATCLVDKAHAHIGLCGIGELFPKAVKQGLCFAGDKIEAPRVQQMEAGKCDMVRAAFAPGVVKDSCYILR